MKRMLTVFKYEYYRIVTTRAYTPFFHCFYNLAETFFITSNELNRPAAI